MPVGNNVWITPVQPAISETVTATHTATSYDGQTLTITYQWKRNGGEILGATAQTLDLTTVAGLQVGDTISVVVTADDGTGTGFLESAASTVVATPVAPTAESPYPKMLKLIPPYPVRNERVEVSYYYWSPDGTAQDGVEIEWYRRSDGSDWAHVPALDNTVKLPVSAFTDVYSYKVRLRVKDTDDRWSDWVWSNIADFGDDWTIGVIGDDGLEVHEFTVGGASFNARKARKFDVHPRIMARTVAVEMEFTGYTKVRGISMAFSPQEGAVK